MTAVASEEEARQFVSERCQPKDFGRVEIFVTSLREESRAQNLVSSGSFGSIWLRHIADSAQLLDHVPRETQPWIDIGTGAGLPGLVLAILDPDRRYVLIESRNLRIRWLKDIVEKLSVSNCDVVGADVGRVPKIDAGVISARAVAPLNRLVALSARFSTTATYWVLPKGRSALQEVAALPSNLRAMFHVKHSATDPDAGIVVATGKVEPAA